MAHKPGMTPKKKSRYRAAAAGESKQGTAPGMSDRAAEERAKELWGQHGAAWHNAQAKKNDLRYCQVGLRVGDTQEGWKVFGKGVNWESAFLDAQRQGYC